MPTLNKVRIEDDAGNVFYPHTKAEVVFMEDGKNAETVISQLSNPNLLINGDFQIWQRGTSFNINLSAVYNYTADRWAITGYNDNPLYRKPLMVNKVTDGLSIQKQANGQVNFQQQIEIPNYLKNKNVVLTFEISSTANENLQVRHMGGTEMDYNVSPTPKKIEFKFNSGNLDVLRLIVVSNTKFITTSPASTIILRWVKLELGEIATPLSPRPVGEELALCQRYCVSQILAGLPYIIDSTYIWFFIPLTESLRTTPTLIAGNMGVMVNGITQTGFTFSNLQGTTNGVYLLATKPNHGLTKDISLFSSTAILDSEIY